MADAHVSEVNEKCPLDLSSYEHLPKPCNATPIPKDDTDGSYVFVTSHDHIASDLDTQLKCSHNGHTQFQVVNGEMSTDDPTKPEPNFVSDKIKVDEAQPGVEETPIVEDQAINQHGDNHRIESDVPTSESSNTDANLSGEIEVESSQRADDIQIHEENREVGVIKSSGNEANHGIDIETEFSHNENGTVAIKFADTVLTSGEEIKANSSLKAEDIQNHEENGTVNDPTLSNLEANPTTETELESSQEVEDIKLYGKNETVDATESSATMEKCGQGEVILKDNETVVTNELSETIDNCIVETEMESFEREEGIQEPQDANLEAVDCHCLNGKEKVDEMVNKAVISHPVGGIEESQMISMGAPKSEPDHPGDSVKELGVALNEENSERTQVRVGEGEESFNNAVLLLEPSEGSKLDMEKHLAAAPSPLVNSADVNGSIFVSIEDGVACSTSFHDNTETLSSSVDLDIVTLETNNFSTTMPISDPKVELNENTLNEKEVNHVLELEGNSLLAAHPKEDECDMVEVLEGTVSENGDEMPTASDESRIFYDDDSAAGSRLITEEIEPSQSTERAEISTVVVEDTSTEIIERSSMHSRNDPVLRSDLETEDYTMSENVAYARGDVQPNNEVHENHNIISHLGDNNFETKSENGDIKKDNRSTFDGNDMRSNSNAFTSIDCEERDYTVSEVPIGDDKSSAILQISAVETDSELQDNSSSPMANDKLGDATEITFSMEGGSGNIHGDDCIVSKTEVLVNDEGEFNPVSDIAFEIDVELTNEQSKVIHEGYQNAPSPISPEGSVDALAGPKVGAEAGTKLSNFLIRVPRFDDENIRELIKCAQTEVERKTKDRDAIRVQMQTTRAAWKVLSDNLAAAVSDGRAARDLLKLKRQEIDSAQSVITKVKNAMSVEDIDGKIHNIKHMIEHETLPLKEEKQLIREIKQLKQLREHLSSTVGKQDELQQALNQKDEIEDRLKLLRKEMDLLRNNVLKAESTIKAAKKKYNDESLKLDDLQSQFKAADKIRQEAYVNLQSLRKQLYEKNKYCWKYRDDVKKASEIALSGDVEKLQRFCDNQLERMMELWNVNAEFRGEYVKSNMKSTLRRLKTLDGRSLGPNEEPHVLNHIVKERPARDNPSSIVPTMREPEKLISADNARDKDKPMTKVVETKSQTTENKEPDTVVALVSGHKNISSEKEVEEPPRLEDIKRTREEEEVAAKVEELRKEEEAIKLKEQRKLEEKAKAKEALERKKRNAEKAHARAIVKARKEAEEKEKLKEKRAKKKERKMAAGSEAGNACNEGESGITMETIPSETAKEEGKQGTTSKRPKQTLQYTKQSKIKSSIPPTLRNRGKRRMQTWMWVVLATLVVFVLFLVVQQRSGFSTRSLVRFLNLEGKFNFI